MKSKQQRREEAAVRQAERASRSIPQQLDIIKTRRGSSKKEVARLIEEANHGGAV